MNWRIPTRVFDYGKEKEANISLLKTNIKDTYQSFYDDYSGSGKLGGKNFASITSLVLLYLVAAVERGFTEELSGRFLKVSSEKSFLAIVLFSKVQRDI